MMSPVINNRFLLCCLIGMTWSGCTYGPSPYGGGYGGYPQGGYQYGSPYQGGYQNYQVPTQTLQPGQQYVPGGTITPGGVYPGGTPTYQNNNGGLQPIPNNGASTDAPPYTSTEINKQVPNPSNPAGGPFYNNSNTSTFHPPIEAKAIQPAALEQEPLRPINNHLRESTANTTVVGPNENYSPPATNVLPAAAPMTNAIDINHPEIPSSAPINSLPSVDTIPSSNAIAPLNSEDDPFSSPIPAPAGNSSSPPAMPAFGNISNIRSNKPIVEETQVFAHEPNYEWLRGVVSQDKPTGTWSVVYSDNPQASDEYAGHLSLASSPFLKGLEDGTVVELQGEVDPVLKDPLGKPFYLVTRLKTISAAPGQ